MYMLILKNVNLKFPIFFTCHRAYQFILCLIRLWNDIAADIFFRFFIIVFETVGISVTKHTKLTHEFMYVKN